MLVPDEVTMKVIDAKAASAYLDAQGLNVGSWNQIESKLAQENKSPICFQAPSDASELLVFSTHLASWVPQGEWKIFQIDNSTVMDKHSEELFLQLLRGSRPLATDVLVTGPASLLFEFGSAVSAGETERLISNLIFAFLLLECHCQLVSSGSGRGEYLSIQDGFAYFFCNPTSVSGVEKLLGLFEANPRRYPHSWP